MSLSWPHHGHVSLENLLDELVLGRVDELDDVGVEAVSVFLQETCRMKTEGKNCEVALIKDLKRKKVKLQHDSSQMREAGHEGA